MADIPKLSILIAAMHSRRWEPLAEGLKRQGDNLPVEVLVFADGGGLNSGEKRALLARAARGEYIAYVDDDDQVASGYVRRMLSALASNSPDVVTFCLEMYVGNTRRNIQRFGLGHADGKRDEDNCVWMMANHLCAWRRDLAALCPWPPDLGYGDDQLWYKPLHLAFGASLKAAHVDDILYTYRYSGDGTANQTDGRRKYSRERYKGGVRVYRYGAGLAVARAGAAHHTGGLEPVMAYDGSEYMASTYQAIGTVQIV